MRIIIQRVNRASVSVGDNIVSAIGKGLLVLVGIGRDDNPDDSQYMKRKVLNTRLWPDPDTQRPWSKSVKQMDYDILFVSQFTLFNTMKGNKPDFHKAMPGNEAREFYEDFLRSVVADYNPDKIKDGAFGEMMNVSLENDGPVTLHLDSRDK
eukprot:TRINITY_DN4782_c0_g1_i3.p1 TRINITY_DN4782_c0_g1~~TRINITY_DN4782_c0_g1_i3.p1  ORF type:complete len:152 (+),score=28.11 TRINITY_DN4782_c0_g1_i3:157-612(+)